MTGGLRWKHPTEISRTKNVILGAFGGLIQALLPFAVVPIYLRLLGPDAYGLIVLNASILAALLFFDRSISLTIVREFGRRNGDPAEAEPMRRLMRSGEWICYALAALVIVAVLLAAPFLAGGWAGRSALPAETLGGAFLLMGLVCAAQWPGYLYAACIGGLQRQAMLAAVKAACALLLHGGGVIFLLATKGDVVTLLGWQCLVFLLQSAVLGFLAWRIMPKADAIPRFDFPLVRSQWRMAVGSLLVALSASAVMQIDKFIVARLAAPDAFAAYGLGFMAVSAILGVVAGALGSAMHPMFSGLLARGEDPALEATYHRWVQVAAIALIPAGVAMAAFPEPLLSLWLGADSPTARLAAKYLTPLALSALLMALLGPMATVLAAAGWHKPVLTSHTAAFATSLLLLPPLIGRNGVEAAAWAMVAIGAAYHAGLGFFMHRRVMRGAFSKAIYMGVLAPMMLCCLIFFGGRALLPTLREPVLELGFAAFLLLIASASTLALLRDGRDQLRDSFMFLRSR